MTRLVRFSLAPSRASKDERGLFAVADLSSIDRTSRPAIRQFALPVGAASLSNPQRMEPGTYLAQVKLPTGKTVSQVVEISPGDAPLDLVIGRRAEPRPKQFRLAVERQQVYAPRERGFARGPISKQSMYSLSELSFPSVPKKTAIAFHAPKFSTRYEESDQRASRISERFEMQSVLARVNPSRAMKALQDPEMTIEEHFPYFLGFPFDHRPPDSIDEDSTDEDSLRISWTEGDLREDLDGGNARAYVHVRPRKTASIGRTYIACVPLSWLNTVSGDMEEIEVEALPVIGALDRLSVAVKVKDAATRSLLAFVQQGNLTAAQSILDRSLQSLQRKFFNPYAAAAAAYCLVLTPDDRFDVYWPEWIGNLAAHFPAISDGDILHATLLLQRGDEHRSENRRYFPLGMQERIDLAVRLCISAICKGPPMYRLGLRFLASNIQLLLNCDVSPAQRLRLSNAARMVAWMSMRVSPLEAFTVLDVTKSKVAHD